MSNFSDMLLAAFRGKEQIVSIADFPIYQDVREIEVRGPKGKSVIYLTLGGDVQQPPVKLVLSDEDKAKFEQEVKLGTLDWLDVPIFEHALSWDTLGFSDPNDWLAALKEAAKDARPTRIAWSYPEV